jgi:AraC-like DNA-binding protein
MIDSDLYLKSVIILAPLSAAALCGTSMAVSVRDSLSHKEKRLRQTVALYFLCSVLSGTGVFLFEFFPWLYADIYPLSMFVFVMAHILFYRIILMLTYKEETNPFRSTHYILPVCVALFLALFIWIVPQEERVRLLLGLDFRAVREHTFIYYVFAARYPIDMLFSLVYTVLALVCIYRYHRKLTLSGKVEKDSAFRWVLLLVALSVLSFLSSMGYLFVPTHQYGISAWAMASSVIYFLIDIELTYPIFVRQYKLYAPAVVDAGQRQYHGEITINRLESYFRRKKPYLNPDYKISNLVEEMDVNRTIVSQFINRTYRVNFSRYVNRWRLQELNRLMKNSANADVRLEKRVALAGFSDMKHYRRVKQQEEKPTENKKPPGELSFTEGDDDE